MIILSRSHNFGPCYLLQLERELEYPVSDSPIWITYRGVMRVMYCWHTMNIVTERYFLNMGFLYIPRVSVISFYDLEISFIFADIAFVYHGCAVLSRLARPFCLRAIQWIFEVILRGCLFMHRQSHISLYITLTTFGS